MYTLKIHDKLIFPRFQPNCALKVGGLICLFLSGAFPYPSTDPVLGSVLCSRGSGGLNQKIPEVSICEILWSCFCDSCILCPHGKLKACELPGWMGTCSLFNIGINFHRRLNTMQSYGESKVEIPFHCHPTLVSRDNHNKCGPFVFFTYTGRHSHVHSCSFLFHQWS